MFSNTFPKTSAKVVGFIIVYLTVLPYHCLWIRNKMHLYLTVVVPTQVSKLHRPKYRHVRIRTGKTREIWIRWVDCINVSILVMIIYYSFVKCYQWGNWAKNTRDLSVLFLTNACESTIISTKILIKKINLYLKDKWESLGTNDWIHFHIFLR